jgi:hypothetical protein
VECLARVSAGGTPGWSKSHNRPFESITFFRGAGLAKIVTPSPFEFPSGRPEIPRRAEVSSFSARPRPFSQPGNYD